MARVGRTPSNVDDPLEATLSDARRVIELRRSRIQLELERLTQILSTLDNGHLPEPEQKRHTRKSAQMSAKQRAAVSRRMKKYWAERRKAQKAKAAKEA